MNALEISKCVEIIVIVVESLNEIVTVPCIGDNEFFLNCLLE